MWTAFASAHVHTPILYLQKGPSYYPENQRDPCGRRFARLAVCGVGGLRGWRLARLAVGGLRGWRFARLAVCGFGGWRGWRFAGLAVCAVGGLRGWRLVCTVDGWFARLTVGLRGWRLARLARLAFCVWGFEFRVLNLNLLL